MENKVYIEFFLESGSKVSIVIPNAKDDIQAVDVTDVAKSIIDSGLFAVNKGDGNLDAFASLSCAYYLRTQKTPLQSIDPENARKVGR